MAITGTPNTIGTQLAAWAADEFDTEIDRLAYQRQKLVPYIARKKPPKASLSIPLHAHLTPSSIATTADMSGHALTFSANTETEKVITPGTVTLNVSINDHVAWRMMTDPTDTFKESIVMAMAQKEDQDISSLFPALTTNTAGSYASPFGKSDYLSLQASVKHGAGEYADEGLYFAYHNLVEDSVFNIDAFVSAAFRGVTKESPAVSGVIPMGFGVTFIPCGNINSPVAGQYANAIWARRAFAIAHNKRASVEAQRFGAANWLICTADYAYGTVRDAYAGLLKSA